MKHPSHIKEKAIALRKRGKTYSEILKEVPVTKSTLSLWLRNVGLAKAQKQRITKKRIDAQKRGALAKQNNRLKTEQLIIHNAAKQINKLSERDLMLIGTALYWAEGSKSNEKNISQGLDFGNSDLRMIKTYLAWLRTVLGIKKNDIYLSLYIHENQKDRIDDVIKFWEKACGFNGGKITYVYYKKHIPKTKRLNTAGKYNGLLRIRVRKSTDLQRKVQGWILGIAENYVSLS